MSKRGLPAGLQMRHDAHYVEELSQHQPAAVGRMISVDKIDPNPEQPRTELAISASSRHRLLKKECLNRYSLSLRVRLAVG